MAALILAEDLARLGQLADAGRFAEYVLVRSGGAADQLFAQEPRSAAWPPEDRGWMAQGADAPGHWGLLVGGSEVSAPTVETWRLAPITVAAATAGPAGLAEEPVPMGRGGAVAVSGPPSTTAIVMSGRLAGEELEQVDRSLRAGDVRAATSRLAVLLRLDPALAPVILSTAERAAAARPAGGDLSAVHLVRGDAYRILGRENEAAAAYRRAHEALSTGPTQEDHP
jgi:hypothetical protein